METVTTVNVTGKTNNMDEKAIAKAERHAMIMSAIMKSTPEQKAQFMSAIRDLAGALR